jgi:hypothetical protein
MNAGQHELVNRSGRDKSIANLQNGISFYRPIVAIPFLLTNSSSSSSSSSGSSGSVESVDSARTGWGSEDRGAKQCRAAAASLSHPRLYAGHRGGRRQLNVPGGSLTSLQERTTTRGCQGRASQLARITERCRSGQRPCGGRA